MSRPAALATSSRSRTNESAPQHWLPLAGAETNDSDPQHWLPLGSALSTNAIFIRIQQMLPSFDRHFPKCYVSSGFLLWPLGKELLVQ